MSREVAIIGGGATSRSVPWNSHRSIAMWGLAACPSAIGEERCDVWFELHPISTISPNALRVCKRSQVPVYMIRKYADIPNAIRYPMERVAYYGDRLFTCSFCYQIALAIAMEYTKINLFGIDLTNGSGREQTVERLGLAYWLGIARGRGIEVWTKDRITSEPYLYGLEYWREVRWVRRKLRELRDCLNKNKLDGYSTERGAPEKAHRIAKKL